ncbi:ArnT family glycosyltransferase [Dyadobacter arcticus]|uniref:4-amino-4-deoxy-L-arabinose transferase-like glycosyltransferase n=1 Tax=Dyadobacter arcticus TaxID=1078754 RepID=A0ABX0UNJ8_9BACT|nr:glycosyltransferase family 39 protein [Dyadobacter arcticus]NIJ54536.1 4-amino-4-deoxy-L-arabinose transferase-like glycosyltransferase [Dyadobacter arcticus]
MARFNYVPYIYAILILAVYFFGLSIPLFDDDSAHHALIGMHMYLTGDYVDLIDRGHDYLDKPHLLFWISAIGDELLGVGTWSYKLPTFLLALPGVYATFRLARRLYGQNAARNAVLVLVSSQAYILAHNDVRMDAILLSFIISATWLLYEYTLTSRIDRLILGTLFLSLAFATKGMTGAAVPVIAVGSQVLYQRNWLFIRSLKWLWAVPLFFIFISPVLFCYYLQFDLHPEKVIRGMGNISGVAFILFFQNTERLQGVNWGSSGGSDPFLFFHSLLWALLPWCLLGYWAVFRKGLFLVKTKFTFLQGEEIMCWTTIVIMFAILTSSNFRLPHYLNILFPFFSILIAGELEKVVSTQAEGKWLMIVQNFVAVLMLLFGLIINFYIFPIKNIGVLILSSSALVLLICEWRYNRTFVNKLVMISFCASLFANLLMNGNFYVQIQQLQAGHLIAARIRQLDIPLKNVYMMDWKSPSMHYYSEYFFKDAGSDTLAKQTDFWVAAPMQSINLLAQESQLEIKESYIFPDFDTTKLKFEFLNPATRHDACDYIGLVHLRKEQSD